MKEETEGMKSGDSGSRSNQKGKINFYSRNNRIKGKSKLQ